MNTASSFRAVPLGGRRAAHALVNEVQLSPAPSSLTLVGDLISFRMTFDHGWCEHVILSDASGTLPRIGGHPLHRTRTG